MLAVFHLHLFPVPEMGAPKNLASAEICLPSSISSPFPRWARRKVPAAHFNLSSRK